MMRPLAALTRFVRFLARARARAAPSASGFDRPARAAWAVLRLLTDVADSILVLHRALPDLQRMKLCYSAAASSAPRSVFSWCD